MRTIKTIACALALASAFVANNAMAVGSTINNLILNVSGTAQYQNQEGTYVGNTTTKSFNQKTVYTLISNAVANVNDLNALAPVHVPANGYIAFTTAGDGGPEYGDGYFYVTNKTGFYFPLSGYDTNDDYYSFIELDSVVFSANDTYLYFGFEGYYYYPFLGHSSTYNLNSQSGNGSGTAKATAVLYIHDDPYYYNDAENPDNLANSDNENAIEIRGVLTATITYKDFTITKESLSITGTGNFFLDDYDVWGIVSGGTGKIAP